MLDYQPRYTWFSTERGMTEDFSCFDGDRLVGRIYLADSLRVGRWFWSMHALGPDIDRRGKKLSDYADSARKAARLVEEAWDASREES